MQKKIRKTKPAMVRKQILLTTAQNQTLKARSAVTGRAEGELLREALDEWLGRQVEKQDDWKEAWLNAAGIWKDRTDLDALYADRRARRLARRRKTSVGVAPSRKR